MNQQNQRFAKGGSPRSFPHVLVRTGEPSLALTANRRDMRDRLAKAYIERHPMRLEFVMADDDKEPTLPIPSPKRPRSAWYLDQPSEPMLRPRNNNALFGPQDSFVPPPLQQPGWVPDPVWDIPYQQRNNALLDSPSNFVPPSMEPPSPPADEIAARFRDVERVSAELASAVAELRRALRTTREVGIGHNQGPPISPDELDAETERLIALLKDKGPRPAPADRALINAQAEKTLQLSEQITGWMKAAGWMVAGVAVREVTKDLTAPLWDQVAHKILELYHVIMAWLSLLP